MPPRTLLMLVIGFIGGLAFAACGTTGSCTTANCGGCCDASGKCQSGAAAETCGTNGASCGRCGTGTICQAGECRAGGTSGGGGGASTGGGGGAATGGGAGGTGGSGGGGCRTINLLDTPQSKLGLAEYRTFMANNGHYNYAAWVYMTATQPDLFRLEVVYPGDVAPTLPYTENFSASTRYGNCTACGIFYEGCDPMTLVCAKQYLAQAGSMTITRADRSSAGRVQGSATSVRFNEWDLANDVSAGAGCIIANSIGPWDVGWNADGGAIP